MSPADRFRRCTLARVLVERLRAGTTLTATAPGADAREVEEAAADFLDAGLAEHTPVAACLDLYVLPTLRDLAAALRLPAWKRAALDKAIDMLEGKAPAEPAPVAGVSAEERARLHAIAERMPTREAVRHYNAVRWADGAETLREAMPRVLAALDASEERAAQAERERDEATHGAEALAARLTEIRSLYEDARAEWRIGGDDAR